MHAEEVRSFVLEFLSGPLSAKGTPPDELPDEYDLLSEGVIDSFGLLEMISALEERAGVEIDFEEIEPEELTLIGPFCRFVARMTQGEAGA